MKILFCNDALCQLTGHDDEFLTELTCVYQTAADQPPSRQLAAGLCPPPDAFEGSPSEGWVSILRADKTEFRQATFIPNQELGEPNTEPAESTNKASPTSNANPDVGVIVFVHGPASDRPTLEIAAQESPDTRTLHTAIRQMQFESANSISIDCLVGISPESQRARRQVALAGKTEANVMILGPQGSGLNKIVSLIHFANGPEMVGPLIPINGALTDQESIQETIKSLYRSNQKYPDEPLGRVFLKNVDKLSEAAQNELLGFLRLPDFRLPLVGACEPEGQTKVLPELWQYLSTLHIEIPALKDRRQDIPFLAQAIVEQFNVANRAQLAGIQDETVSSLVRYAWPGELNELESVIDEACRNATPPHIKSADLPQYLRIALRADTAEEPAQKTVIDLDAFLTEIEDELIQRAVAHTGGNKSQAARLLGISRPRLLRRLGAIDGDIEAPEFIEADDDTDEEP